MILGILHYKRCHCFNYISSSIIAKKGNKYIIIIKLFTNVKKIHTLKQCDKSHVFL